MLYRRRRFRRCGNGAAVWIVSLDFDLAVGADLFLVDVLFDRECSCDVCPFWGRSSLGSFSLNSQRTVSPDEDRVKGHGGPYGFASEASAAACLLGCNGF